MWNWKLTNFSPQYFHSRDILHRHHVHGGLELRDDHHDPELSPQDGGHPRDAWLGRESPKFLIDLNILSRLLLSSSNGFHGCLKWPDLVRRSPGRQSWWPRRWRSWTSRRPPPSLCSPMCLTWMMTSGGLLCPGSPPPPPTRVTWHHHRTIREYSGQTKSVSVFISSQSHSSGSTFYFLICLDGHNIASINYNLGPMSMYGKTSGDIYCQSEIYRSKEDYIKFTKNV